MTPFFFYVHGININMVGQQQRKRCQTNTEMAGAPEGPRRRSARLEIAKVAIRDNLLDANMSEKESGQNTAKSEMTNEDIIILLDSQLAKAYNNALFTKELYITISVVYHLIKKQALANVNKHMSTINDFINNHSIHRAHERLTLMIDHYADYFSSWDFIENPIPPQYIKTSYTADCNRLQNTQSIMRKELWKHWAIVKKLMNTEGLQFLQRYDFNWNDFSDVTITSENGERVQYNKESVPEVNVDELASLLLGACTMGGKSHAKKAPAARKTPSKPKTKATKAKARA